MRLPNIMEMIQQAPATAAKAAADCIQRSELANTALQATFLHVAQTTWTSGGTTVLIPYTLIAQIFLAIGAQWIPQVVQKAVQDFLCLLLWNLACGTAAATGYGIVCVGETIYNGAKCFMFRRQPLPDNPEKYDGFDMAGDECEIKYCTLGNDSLGDIPSPIASPTK